MVRAKLRLLFSHSGGVQTQPSPFAVHTFAGQELQDKYVRSLEQKLVDWNPSSECIAEEAVVI